MKPIFRTLVCLVALASLALALDPRLTAVMMKDPKLVAGINVEQARNSPFGQLLLSNLKDDDAGLQKLLSETGFDPRKDILEVLVAASAVKNPQNGIVAVRGIFNQTKINSFVRTLGATPVNYNGVEVFISPASKEGSMGFAFFGDSILVAGAESELKAAIDRQKAGTGGFSADMVTKVNYWSGRHDAWMISNEPISGFGPFPAQGTAPGGLSVDSIRAASAGVRFGSVVEVNAEATMRSAQDATAFADVIRFITSMVKMNQDPKNAPPQQLTKMLDTMTLNTSGTQVNISFSMPESDLESLIAPKPRAAAAQKTAVR